MYKSALEIAHAAFTGVATIGFGIAWRRAWNRAEGHHHSLYERIDDLSDEIVAADQVLACRRPFALVESVEDRAPVPLQKVG